MFNRFSSSSRKLTPAVHCDSYCSVFVFSSWHSMASKHNPSSNTNNNAKTNSRLVFHSSLLSPTHFSFWTSPEQLPCQLWTLHISFWVTQKRYKYAMGRNRSREDMRVRSFGNSDDHCNENLTLKILPFFVFHNSVVLKMYNYFKNFKTGLHQMVLKQRIEYRIYNLLFFLALVICWVS